MILSMSSYGSARDGRLKLWLNTSTSTKWRCLFGKWIIHSARKLKRLFVEKYKFHDSHPALVEQKVPKLFGIIVIFEKVKAKVDVEEQADVATKA
jgi:hypothetical protein